MSIRPATALPTNATLEFLWESDEFGACVTAERNPDDEGSSWTYVTLWLLASDTPEHSAGIQQGRIRCCRTESGEMRRWVTVEWLPIYGETNQWVDGCDDDGFASATLDELVIEAKERAAAYARQRLPAADAPRSHDLRDLAAL